MTTNELIEAFINDNNYLDFVVKELKELRMPDDKHQQCNTVNH